MDLSSYLSAIRKSWWVVLALVLIGGGIELARSEAATPIYESHVTFYVTPATSGSATLSSDQFAQDRAKSYADLLSSDLLAQRIFAKVGSPSQDAIRREISGSVELNTVLVSAVIKDPSRTRALDLAKAMSTEFPSLVKNLDTVGAKGSPLVSLRLVSGPRVQSSPVSPRKQFNVIIGLAVGLILGLLAAVARYALARSRDERSAAATPRVAESSQPVISSANGGHAASVETPLAATSEAESRNTR